MIHDSSYPTPEYLKSKVRIGNIEFDGDISKDTPGSELIKGDCVMPSRNGRHGKLFTWEGTVNILNEKYATDPRPISESCGCPACRHFSRAYIRHLFKADEVLALRLAVLHNLYFYNELAARIRRALDEGTFADFRARYSGNLEKRA